METNYWLHRISYLSEYSYPLLEKGILTIGWQKHQKDIEFDHQQKKIIYDTTVDKLREIGKTDKSIYALINFISFHKGDIIVVPKFDGEFGIYRVKCSAKPINRLNITLPKTLQDQEMSVTSEGLQNTKTKKTYDLGFFVKVTPLAENMKRNIANAALVSRMKYRRTNAKITEPDLHREIDELPTRESKASIYKKEIITDLCKHIQLTYGPDNFENIVQHYMQRLGAITSKPAKNEPGKMNGADADVIADFEEINVRIYIQVKKHEGETDANAVHQIVEYLKQKSLSDENDYYTHIAWVVSTGDFNLDETTKQEAKANKVVLIDGNQFARKLMEAGCKSMDSVLWVEKNSK